MTREINIRLNANSAKVVHTGYKFASGDKGIVFRIAVESMDTVGTTAKIVFKRSNGTSVEADITEENGIYCYTTLGNEFAVVGPVTADVKFYEGEKRLSTCTFVFDVISDTMDGIGAGTGGYSDTLERMKESMEQTESEMLEVKRDMEAYAEAFLGAYPFNPCGAYSETESYTVRDMVTHNDVAWVCYKDCTGATPAMDSDCWMPLAIKVVDAETLDGHGAEYFAPLTDLANYLPLTGGTVNKAHIAPINLNNTNTDVAYTGYLGKGSLLGYLGMYGKNRPSFLSADSERYDLLYTGNKPNGTYTGNGDATERTVSIGGVGETLRIVNSALGIAFVTNDGAHCITKNGFLIIPPSECKFTNGTLTMATTSSVVNANGYGFSYDLL